MPQCPRNRRYVACACAAMVAAYAAQISPRPARGEAPVAGVVILRNGNILEGAVRRIDGFYIVERGGASLQVPVAQVEMACGSLVEAYENRRLERVGASADAHLELARWCLRHHLLDQAAREVLDARIRDPGHPALPAFDLRIQQALEIEASRQARAEQEAARLEAADAPALQLSLPGSTLHPSLQARTQFVRSIQPMLVQGCATGGCHQPGAAQRLQLDRWALEGNGNPELIRRNLESVLTQIDAADPASSPLILRARQMHGNARDGVSEPLATFQTAMLLDWLDLAAGAPPRDSLEDAAATGQSEEGDLTAAQHRGPYPQTQQPSAGAPTAFTPRDAFDPDIFNRQVDADQPTVDEHAADEPAPANVDELVELDAIGDAIDAAAGKPM